jgi:uncharacterized protein YqeY
MQERDGKMVLELINKDKIMYMKAKDAMRLSAVRMLLADVKNEQIKLGKELTDEDVYEIIHKLSNQLEEGLSYALGRDNDKATEYAIQIETIKYYLSKQLTHDELKELVLKVISDNNFKTSKDVGRAMKILMPLTKGKTDNKNVSNLVKSYLNDSQVVTK